MPAIPPPTALVVLDAQNAMVAIAHDADRIVARIGRLVEAARTAGAEVIHIQHDHDDYVPMTPGHPGWRLHDATAPIAGETVVHKTGADAFDGTPSLDALLRERSVTGLALAGMATEHCIEAAMNTALDLGYALTLAGDAHTTARDDDVLIEMGLAGRGGAEAARIIADHNDRWAREAARPVRVAPADTIRFAPSPRGAFAGG
jgi:nicotinamidase-related amidase